MAFKSAVIGLGGIGMGYDFGDTDGTSVLTHANAFHRHAGFTLAAGVDPSPEARARFTARFGAPAFATIGELAPLGCEVISVATPTDAHASHFAEALALRPRAIICEKPLASRHADAARIVALADGARQTLVLVNFIRRFDPGAIEVGRRVARGDFGTFQKGVVWYSKGILNNGSHYIDLLRFWLGEVTDVQRLSDPAGPAHDPDVDARVRFGATDVYFIAVDKQHYSAGDITLMGTHGSVAYLDGGDTIRVRAVVEDPQFAGYRSLDKSGEEIASGLARYQLHVLDALAAALAGGAPLVSTAATAFGTQAVVERILKKLAP